MITYHVFYGYHGYDRVLDIMSMYGSSVYNFIYYNYIKYLICYLHDWTLLIGVNIKNSW